MATILISCLIELQKNGERHYDWNLSRHNRNRFDKHILETNQKLLPYDIAHLSKYMYISGAFFILKKHVANNISLRNH